MELKFFSIDEVREFVKGLKGTRGGKAGDDEATAAPAPIMPPQGQSGGFPGASGFAPPGAGAGPQGGGFPAAGAIGPAPEVLALVQRIVAKIDGSVASGQPAEVVLTWFRGQCGPEAANATLDQIKQIALPRMSVPALEAIAKLMNA